MLRRAPALAATLVLTLLETAAGGATTVPVNGSFASAAGTIGYDVYLPSGYATSHLRYPVVYYLHGLPAGPNAYHSAGYVARAIAAAGLQVILVAPQGATAAQTDPEYLDAGPGQDWEQAIAVQLPKVIDATFRTIPNRTGRGIVGVSAGGYGAALLGLHHLGLYSAIESWSGYFHPTDPTGSYSISERPWLSAHTFVASLNRAFKVNPTYLGFYVGAADRFRPENVELARELSRADVPFTFREYPGGHRQSLWTAQARAWLTLLAQHLASAEGGG